MVFPVLEGFPSNKFALVILFCGILSCCRSCLLEEAFRGGLAAFASPVVLETPGFRTAFRTVLPAGMFHQPFRSWYDPGHTFPPVGPFRPFFPEDRLLADKISLHASSCLLVRFSRSLFFLRRDSSSFQHDLFLGQCDFVLSLGLRRCFSSILKKFPSEVLKNPLRRTLPFPDPIPPPGRTYSRHLPPQSTKLSWH